MNVAVLTEIIKETKTEIALIEDPPSRYDLTEQDTLEVIEDDVS